MMLIQWYSVLLLNALAKGYSISRERTAGLVGLSSGLLGKTLLGV